MALLFDNILAVLESLAYPDGESCSLHYITSLASSVCVFIQHHLLLK